ncbi:HMG1/2-like protein [Carica papaya]|uniref:HMG1/2-like protein n=1 Tax=Carica papaya TaxID=3649 RepID=UPI000B8C8680|nr:HMG1/2-like protein [Carica papaya]
MKGGKSKADSTKTDARLKGKSTGAGKRGGKKEKDPNKPKRPPSAFFVFMEEFRKQFKEAHPENRSVSVVGKAAGEKWKSMTAAEKAPFVAKSEKRKAEYNKKMQTYNRKLAGGANEAEDDESDKSKSEVHDEEEEEGSGEDDEE